MIAAAGFQYISKTGWVFTYGLFFYFLQVFLNVIWSPLFFWKRLITLAFIDLILLWISVLITIILFHEQSPLAAYLLVPYICWLCMAGYLNGYVVIMNPNESEFRRKK
jgi:benzodiazapine receptor